MTITVPELSLVVLIGASSSGKSVFARKHFSPTEIISSDQCRAMVADDENALDVNREAFDVLQKIASTRLKLRRLAVIDATNVQADARKPLIQLARDNDVLAVAIVFDLAEGLLQERSRHRADRDLLPHVIRNQSNDLRRSLRNLQREGFRYVHVLRSPEEVDAVVIERQRLWTDRRDELGPFDVIGRCSWLSRRIDRTTCSARLSDRRRYISAPARTTSSLPRRSRRPRARHASSASHRHEYGRRRNRTVRSW
jgi:predicted kinase